MRADCLSKMLAIAMLAMAVSAGTPARAEDRAAKHAASPSLPDAKASLSARGSATARIYGFVDFIAREDAPAGHAYLRYGRFDAKGQPTDMRYTGLYPKQGLSGFIAGHFTPVESIVGRHKDDVDSRTMLQYRRTLTREQYAKLHAAVRTAEAKHKQWHALSSNCNEYVGELARAIGLSTPPTSYIPPLVYIGGIRALNAQ